MASDKFNRVELLVGNDAMQRLASTRVIIFGVGGVGSWAAESLVRSSIGHITLVDFDRVEESNINRQLPATTETIGDVKVDVMADRLRQINPDCDIVSIRQFYTEATANEFNLEEYDYVIDAIDSLRDKALLIINATRCDHPKLFSSMGAALKMDATAIDIAEFWKVKGCPLAAALRRKFKSTGVYPEKKFKCIYSPELYQNRGPQPVESDFEHNNSTDTTNLDNVKVKKAQINGTMAHTTAIFGFMLAGLVINDICR
ncbi:MAG: tRNA threonylcarbamoyladenosine dehydratase [Muribaculaceae bacterium]|nr:tRNA threonylcarbamoyladenosine dehydratase [Muribaculaceae bacterium]